MIGSPFFFHVSRSSYAKTTEIFDFIWPTAAAMWNLRWQVKGYKEVRPDATSQEINARFVHGSNIHGANLIRSCITDTWEQQQEKFAEFLLIQFCALYEGAVGGILKSIGVKNRNMEGALWNPEKVSDTLSKIVGSGSDILKQCFYNSLIKNKKNCIFILNNMMVCYNYFKKCRNCIAHNNGIVNGNVVEAYDKYIVLKAEDLCAKEAPSCFYVAEGDKVKLSLRGVVGFADIVLKLIATMDAEISKSSKTEGYFVNRWKSMLGRPSLKLNESDRDAQIKRLVTKLYLPAPDNIPLLYCFLKDNQLVS